jgi:hypothetical protein
LFAGGRGLTTVGSAQIEEVWKREQEAEQEKVKIAELQKQIAEERRHEELHGVAAASGHVQCVICCPHTHAYIAPAS